MYSQTTAAVQPEPALQAASDIDVFFQQASGLHKIGQWEAASYFYEQVLVLQGQHFETMHMLGLVALQTQSPEVCVEWIDQALALSPPNASMHFHRALALEKLLRLDEAIRSYDRAIAIRPAYVEALVNRAAVWMQLGRTDLAVVSLQQAIKADDTCVPAYLNLGNAHTALKQWELSTVSYRRAMDLDPGSVTSPIYLAKALRMLGRVPEAITRCEAALAHHPASALVHWNLAHLLLLSGQWERGWTHYEWRWKYAENAKYQRAFAQPMWDGVQTLEGKTLLLHHEQGLGDTIQFCRYALLCSQLGARVLLEVPSGLLGLMQGLAGVSALIECGQVLPAFDFHCPLLSLPGRFGTTPENAPGRQPYLQALESKKRYWQERLGPMEQFKVGVVWSGGVRAAQAELNVARNIPLAMVAEALSGLDIAFFSLQKGEPAESEIGGQEQKYWPSVNFYNFSRELRDLADTAALIAQMDLVISVDTSTLHLAAAMGKPTWLLNKYDTCWRWLLDGDTSPWYPTLKIYRQDAKMDWNPVLERMAADLAHAAESHARRSVEGA